MKLLKQYWFSWMILVLQCIAVLYCISIIPESTKIPMHWNIQGNVDGYGSASTVACWGIGTNVFLLLLFIFFPYISPKYKNDRKQYEKLLPVVTGGMVLLFAALNIYSYLLVLLPNLVSVNAIFILIGLLMCFLGNLMPKVPQNFFLGIRTPWTLNSKEIWHCTHRLSGYLYVIAGVLLILSSFIPSSNGTLRIALFVLAFMLLMYPVLYSFFLFRKENKKAL